MFVSIGLLSGFQFEQLNNRSTVILVLYAVARALSRGKSKFLGYDPRGFDDGRYFQEAGIFYFYKENIRVGVFSRGKRSA